MLVIGLLYFGRGSVNEVHLIWFGRWRAISWPPGQVWDLCVYAVTISFYWMPHTQTNAVVACVSGTCQLIGIPSPVSFSFPLILLSFLVIGLWNWNFHRPQKQLLRKQYNGSKSTNSPSGNLFNLTTLITQEEMLTVRRILTNLESKSTCQCYPSHRLKKYYRKRQTTSEKSILIFRFSQSNNRLPRISLKNFNSSHRDESKYIAGWKLNSCRKNSENLWIFPVPSTQQLVYWLGLTPLLSPPTR